MADNVEGGVKIDVEVEIEKAQEDLKKTADTADDTKKSLDDLNKKQDETRIKSIQTLTATMALSNGIIQMTNSIQTLVPMSDEMAANFAKGTAMIQLFVGTAQTLKGATMLFNALSASMIRSAVASVAARVAANPVVAAVTVGAIAFGVGLAIGVLTVNNDNRQETYIQEPTSSEPELRRSMISTGGWD